VNRAQVLTFARQNPGLTPSQISEFADLSAFEVKDILDDDDFETANDFYIETKNPMMKGLKFSEIQCAARHTGTLWGDDAEC
jgi:hypothetical protein